MSARKPGGAAGPVPRKPAAPKGGVSLPPMNLRTSLQEQNGGSSVGAGGAAGSSNASPKTKRQQSGTNLSNSGTKSDHEGAENTNIEATAPGTGKEPHSSGAQTARAYVPHKPPSEEIKQPMTARDSEKENMQQPTAARKSSDPCPEDSVDLLVSPGMTAPQALETYKSVLTPYEVAELQGQYGTVWYAGQHCDYKIVAPVEGGNNFGYDDDRSDYIVLAKDHIAYRYEIISFLGNGSFGQVVKAIDHKDKTQVALKIIRNKRRFHQQAMIEIRLLNHLKSKDPDGKYGIIRLFDTFEFRGHTCLTFELLSLNLYDYLKQNRFHPMSCNVVKKIGASVLISLAFMARENIVHCDLKPENILLRLPNRTGVKVIDLGSACFENDRLYTYIQSRFYRAPEVMMHLGYTKKIDLWSFACVLCELATGYPIFPGENECEQMACIMEVIGLPPQYLIEMSPRAGHFFEKTAHGQISAKPVTNSRGKTRIPGSKSIHGFLGLDKEDPFVNFVSLFLQWDPELRPQPEPAMRHPWICDAYVGLQPKIPVIPQRHHQTGALIRSSNGSGNPLTTTTNSPKGAVASSTQPQQSTSPSKAKGQQSKSNVPTLPSIPKGKR